MHRLSSFVHKTLAWMESHRLFRPWRHHFRERALWRFDRHGVARGVAIGFFFGVMTPVAQIVFAAVAAIVMRANIVVAAGSTLITNPFTFPVVYYAAFRIGVFVTGPSREIAEDLAVSEEAARHALEVENWYTTLTAWTAEVGFPLIVGLFTLASTLALFGYLLVHAGWRSFLKLRRRRRLSIRR